jgi:hypothetical protein
MLKKRKFWFRLGLIFILTPILIFVMVIGILFWKQDAIVQELIVTINKDFTGELEIKGSHISPFETSLTSPSILVR